jgi:hypothetical protein
MLLFLAAVLEQLDLALEHVSKRDVHNARFGLMLTDTRVVQCASGSHAYDAHTLADVTLCDMSVAAWLAGEVMRGVSLG